MAFSMTSILRRIRGALGFGALGALGFHAIGWLIVGVEALMGGVPPSLGEITRMTMFTLPVGGMVGVLSAGAIALGAGASRFISKGRAFLVGLPIGATAGAVLSLTAASLPPSVVLLNAATFGVATGLLGAGAVAVAERAAGRDEIAGPADRAEIPDRV